MNAREKAITLTREGLKKLRLEIERHEKGAGTVGETSQLYAFQLYLEDILLQLESNHIPEKSMRKCGMGRAIVDSWPLESKLGNLLCSAEQAYRNL